MPTEQFKAAKNKWLEAKKTYDETALLYEKIFVLLEFQHNELNKAFSDFSIEQSRQVRRSSVKAVKEQ